MIEMKEQNFEAITYLSGSNFIVPRKIKVNLNKRVKQRQN